MNKLNLKFFLTTALLGGLFVFASCGGSQPANTGNAKPANSTNASNTTSTSNTTAPAGDSVGVAECDEYIKKYETCLMSIAKKAPAAEAPMKDAFAAQRKAFKDAAANPTTKASLAATCKTAMETSKKATAAYACEW